GDVVDIRNDTAVKSRKVPAGNTLVDGWGIGDVGNVVLRDRRHLAEDGILVVVVTLSRTDGAILTGPDIISRGFVYVRESEGLMEEVNRLVVVTIKELQENKELVKWSILKHRLKEALGKY